MNTFFNRFLIVFAIIILFLGVYTYFSNELNAQAAGTSALSSSMQGNGVGILNSTADDKLAQDTAFLTTLASLNRLQISTTLFANPAFTSLKDNTIVLDRAIPGRPNPFAPIDNSSLITVPQSPVITNAPTQITNKSAFLNGGVESNLGATNTYFEYGPSAALGKSTPNAKQSLIGNFIINVSGLASKTIYYYRAVAKINGVTTYGEIVSFTTN